MGRGTNNRNILLEAGETDRGTKFGRKKGEMFSRRASVLDFIENLSKKFPVEFFPEDIQAIESVLGHPDQVFVQSRLQQQLVNYINRIEHKEGAKTLHKFLFLNENPYSDMLAQLSANLDLLPDMNVSASLEPKLAQIASGKTTIIDQEIYAAIGIVQVLENPVFPEFKNFLDEKLSSDYLNPQQLHSLNQVSQSVLAAYNAGIDQNPVACELSEAKEIAEGTRAAKALVYRVANHWHLVNSPFGYTDGYGPSGITYADCPGIVTINKDLFKMKGTDEGMLSLLVHELTHVNQDLGENYFKGDASPRVSRALVEGITEIETTERLKAAGKEYWQEVSDKPGNYLQYLGYQYLVRSALKPSWSREEQLKFIRDLTGQENNHSIDWLKAELFPGYRFDEHDQDLLLRKTVEYIEEHSRELAAYNRKPDKLLDWVKDVTNKAREGII